MADGYTGVHTRRALAARNAMLASARAVEAAAPTRSRLAVPVADQGSVAPAGLVHGLRAFAAGHGGATAVIEYAGRKGARIVLVGGDGVTGAEQYAESTEAARVACAQAGVGIEHEWERELTEQMQVSTDLWSARGRRVLSR
jgi:hypothetical protein